MDLSGQSFHTPNVDYAQLPASVGSFGQLKLLQPATCCELESTILHDALCSLCLGTRKTWWPYQQLPGSRNILRPKSAPLGASSHGFSERRRRSVYAFPQLACYRNGDGADGGGLHVLYAFNAPCHEPDFLAAASHGEEAFTCAWTHIRHLCQGISCGNPAPLLGEELARRTQSPL